MLLDSLGFKIPDETIEQLEKIALQLPVIIPQGVNLINNAVRNFDTRLQALEQQNAELIEMVRTLKGVTQDGGTDRNQHLIANGTHN